MNTSCNLSIPYPEIKVERQNRKTAHLLFQLLLGPAGELKGISDYSFQSIITEDNDPALSDILDCISVTEMKHFRIISVLIRRLGSTPFLWMPDRRGHRQYWNTSLCNIETKPSKFLQENIQNEKNSITNYKQLLLQINDRHIRRMIERIILDEEHHIEIFSSLIK